jgi:ribosome-associated protein
LEQELNNPQSKLSGAFDEPTFAGKVAKEKISRKKKAAPEVNILLEAVVHGMSEIKAKDIVIMDLRSVGNAMADYFVVCHGGSNTQVQAIADSVERETMKLANEKPLHVEGVRNAAWILMDYVDIVVHIFDKDSRTFYALEELWADAVMTRITE